MYAIKDEYIAEAERLLINDNHFDQEMVEFIKSLDSCDLLAVPGSGKTTALQAKLYCLSKNRPTSTINGILVLSHTNAAVEEFRNKLSTVCPSLFEYPNFVGTIQDFIDSFLAIPFYNQTYAQNITRIDSAIYKEEFSKVFLRKFIKNDKVWYWYSLKGAEQALNFGVRVYADGRVLPWNYSSHKEFIPAATRTPKTWAGKEDKNRKHILDILCGLKHQLLEKGILNYDDCYLLAQMFINKNPRIKSIIRNRFKYIFIDETQDLQEHQLDIVDQLFNDESVCLQRIGDINQSIFHAGISSTDCIWNPRNTRTFNNSLRLAHSTAIVVDAFMYKREAGQNVNGLRVLQPEIPPYIIVYDYPHKSLLKEKFTELIRYYNLNNIPEKKYGFHIVGWNSKWSDGKNHSHEEIRLSDLYPEHKSKNIYSSEFPDSLASYIYQLPYFTDNKQRSNFVDIIVCECFRLCNKLDSKIVRGHTCNRPYTPKSLNEYLNIEYKAIVVQYKIEVFNIVKKMVRLKCEEVYNDIKSVVEWLFDIISIERSSEYLSFIEKPYIPIVIEEQQEDISIEIETIHRAKGQTHCATLYVETLYEGKYESTHVLNRVSKKATKKSPAIYCSNPFYREIGVPQTSSYAQSAMKMAYVGMSRPTHLLCYAMHKSSFIQYDSEQLRASGWQIIDLTSNV